MNKLKGALVGSGFIGSLGHMPAYRTREDIEIVAICDLSHTHYYHEFPRIPVYKNFDELLKTTSDLDFVDIATNATSHFELTKKSLEKGLHVLCEKPLTTSFSEASFLAELARRRKKVLYPCHNYKHAPVVKAIREILDSGHIGKVHTVTMQTFRNTHAVGAKKWKPDWRRHKKYSGGGIAMDHGSHSLYLAFEWMRAFPNAVSAFGVNSRPDLFDTEDTFSATYVFPTGHAYVFLTWTAGVRKVIYTIHGTRGAIKIEEDDLELASMHSDASNEKTSHKAEWDFKKIKIDSDWMDSSHVNWFKSMLDGFSSAIEENNSLSGELEEALWCVNTIEHSYESMANNGQLIKIPKVEV